MKGFSNRFSDFPDYIIGITKEIWEDRGIATLHQYYREGMLSSHRLLSTATHLNDGMYGAATGKPLVYRIMADCHAINNQINDEWLIRDQGAIVRQMGWDPKQYAADLIEREGGPAACVKPLTPSIDQPGPYKGRGNDNAWGQRYADILTRIMGADMAVIPTAYDRAVQTEYPGGMTGHSHGSVDGFWMGLRASFPNATFQIDQPTGKDVYLLGICHAEFGQLSAGSEPTVRREYAIYDEAMVWKQILLQTG